MTDLELFGGMKGKHGDPARSARWVHAKARSDESEFPDRLDHIAQYYVRMRGAKICRFSLTGWRDNSVPYRKEFRQAGLVDSVMRGLQRSAFTLARVCRLRWLVQVLESATRRIKSV